MGVTYNPTNTGNALAYQMLMRGLATYSIMVLVAYVLMVIGLWKVFSKADEPGWKAIIPIYNIYILYKIAWKPSMFWVTVILGFVYSVTYSMGVAMMGSLLAVLLLLISLAASIAALVISIMSYYKLSRSFGYGVGYTLGLIFLFVIFILILGFGSAEYEGPEY